MGTAVLSLARFLVLKETMCANHEVHSVPQRARPPTTDPVHILLEHLICMRDRKAIHFRTDSEHSIRGNSGPDTFISSLSGC